MSGMEPTVDTVAVQTVPAYWCYLLAAGGGALFLLLTITGVAILCHRRPRPSMKTGSSHHHSVVYHNEHSAHRTPLCPGSGSGLQPTLVVRQEKDDSCGSRC